MANLSSNPVILRNNKKREKRSIYSRYFKEFSFKSIPGCGSLPSELVSVSNRNMNISNKTGHTAPVRSSAGGMFRNKTYADQVRELLRKDPVNVDTLDRIKHRGRPPLPPNVEMRETGKYGRKHVDQTSTSHQFAQLAPEDISRRKVYVRNTGADAVIKSKLSTFSSVISRPSPPPPAPARSAVSAVPSSAVSSSRVKTADLSEALKAFTVSTAQSRENLRTSRLDLAEMEDITKRLVRHRSSRQRLQTL